MITIDNYEEYLVMHADGELPAPDEAALQVFLDEHPHLKDELKVYEQTRLIPEEAIVYTAKASLLKPVPAKKIAFIPGWRTLSAAAGIAALVVLAGIALRDTNTTKVEVAANSDNQTKQPMQRATAIDTPAQQNMAAKEAVKTPIAANDKAQAPSQPLAAHIHTLKTQKNSTGLQTLKETTTGEERLASTQHLAMATLNPSGITQLPVEEGQFENTANVDMGNYELAQTIPAGKKSWIDRLPIDDDKKDHLNALATALSSGAEKVNDFKTNLNDKKLTVTLEKRRLILSF